MPPSVVPSDRAPKSRASNSRTSTARTTAIRTTGTRATGKTLADVSAWNGVRSIRRMEIFEAIRSIGPLSVPELSEIFGQESTGLYYHIRLLHRAGLIHAIEGSTSESFAASESSVKLKCNLKNAKESKRLGKLVAGYTATSQASFAHDLNPTGRGSLLRGLRWENLDASEVARIKKLQQQIQDVLEQAKVRRGRSKTIDQLRATWHVGCFIQPAGDGQFPLAVIEVAPTNA